LLGRFDPPGGLGQRQPVGRQFEVGGPDGGTLGLHRQGVVVLGQFAIAADTVVGRLVGGRSSFMHARDSLARVKPPELNGFRACQRPQRGPRRRPCPWTPTRTSSPATRWTAPGTVEPTPPGWP